MSLFRSAYITSRALITTRNYRLLYCSSCQSTLVYFIIIHYIMYYNVNKFNLVIYSIHENECVWILWKDILRAYICVNRLYVKRHFRLLYIYIFHVYIYTLVCINQNGPNARDPWREIIVIEAINVSFNSIIVYYVREVCDFIAVRI